MLFHIFPLVLLCAIAVVVGGAVDREGSLVLWRAIDRVARTDSEQYLAQLYPHIPASQRPHVGVVPSNIRVSTHHPRPHPFPSGSLGVHSY